MAPHRTSCCGCRSIPDLTEFKTPVDVLGKIGLSYINMRGAFLVFTSETKRTLGRRLANYIVENKLGVVTETDYRKCGSANVRVFMWAVDMTAWKAWLVENNFYPTPGMKVRVNEEFTSYYGRQFEGVSGTISSVSSDAGHITFVSEEGRTYTAYLNQFDLI